MFAVKVHDDCAMTYCTWCMEPHFSVIAELTRDEVRSVVEWMVNHWQFHTNTWNVIKTWVQL